VAWKCRNNKKYRSILGELENRKEDLINNGILSDAAITITPDPMNGQQIYADIELYPRYPEINYYPFKPYRRFTKWQLNY